MTTNEFRKKSVIGLHGAARILTCFLVAFTFQHQLAAAGESLVPLGRAGNFAVLAGSTVTSTGATIVNGDLGVSPGTAVTGFPPGTIVGTMHAGDAVAANAQIDLTIAYNDAAGRSTAPVSVSGNLGGLTLTPGLFKSSSSLEISAGDLTLDARGDSTAVFIFQMASTFVTTSGRKVILAGGAQPANIFWQVGSSATIGTTSVMKGNILADQSITLQTGATLDGRALARIAAVTMDSNIINGPAAATNQPSACAIRISCAFTLPGDTNAYVISLDKSSACLVLDGSASNHDAAQISWLLDRTNLQSGAIITNCFSLGCHSIILSLAPIQNGPAACESDLCVITAADAVNSLISLVEEADLATKKKGCGYKGSVVKAPLLATLKAAAAAFHRGSLKAGINQLHAFQHKVRAQLGRTHSASAALFTESAETILDAIDCSARTLLKGIHCHQGGERDDHHDGRDTDDHREQGDDDDDDGKA